VHACGFLPLLLLNRNRKHVTNVVGQNNVFPSAKEVWQMCTTFIFVTFAWIFFRADTIHHALSYIKKIFLELIHLSSFLRINNNELDSFYYIFTFIIFDWLLRNDERKLRMPIKKSSRLILYLLFSIVIIIHVANKNSAESFIYFQF